jgi:hypothetical protein
MKIRSTIVAVLLAVASAGAAWFAWQQEVRDDASSHEGPRRLFSRGEIPIDAVERITLRRDGEAEMIFARRDGEWMQVAPVAYPVDLFSMRQLIIAAHDLETLGEPIPADPGALDSMSLDPPRGIITFEWPEGSMTLRLGRAGVGGMAYLQIEDEPGVFLVRKALHDRAVEQSPFEWRRQRVFDQAGIDSTRLAVEGIGAGSYIIERAGRAWTMTSPVLARLEAPAVEEHLAFLGALQAESFIADAPADRAAFGLETARAAVTVTSAQRAAVAGAGDAREETVERLLIGAASGLDQGNSLFAMMEGREAVFTISRGVFERIAASGHLIDLRALAINPADVRSVRVSTATDEFTLTRDRDDPANWSIDDGAETAVRTQAVAALLETLTAARAQDAEAGDFPFEAGVGHITLFDFSGDPLGAVQIARREDGSWVFFSDDHLLRVFPSSVLIPFERSSFVGE